MTGPRDFPGADYDRWKTRSDLDDEPELTLNGVPVEFDSAFEPEDDRDDESRRRQGQCGAHAVL